MAETATMASGRDLPAADARLGADLDRIAAMDLTGLRRRWRQMFGSPPPRHLPRSLLQRVLAYRVQAATLGDLDRETVRQLDRLSKGAVDTIPLPEWRAAKPGTLLVREWDGTLERVMVLDKGFVWNGATYDSLSKVARAITGTSWNGPRFFGLRDKGSRDRGTSP